LRRARLLARAFLLSARDGFFKRPYRKILRAGIAGAGAVSL
jgi:hypothetical protein